MPISDELEALRQSSRVKTQSTRLATASSSALYTPQQQEELRKAKLNKEKQSKLEAERAMRSGATYNINTNVGGLHDLLGNGMYGRLMNEHRRKVREAQKQLHEWKGKHQGKQGGKDDGGKSNETNNTDGDVQKTDNEEIVQDEEENTIISNAVEMLPDHVVEALKAKYETDSIVEALTKALQEEESGDLSKIMSPVSKESEEGSIGSNAPAPKEEEKVQEEEEEQEQKEEELQEEEAEVVEQNDEEQQGDTEEATEAPQEEQPIEEVREKIENLSINDAVTEEVVDKEIEEQAESVVPVDDAVVEEQAEPEVPVDDAVVEEPKATATVRDVIIYVKSSGFTYQSYPFLLLDANTAIHHFQL